MLKQEWGTCGQRATPAEVLNEVRVRTLLRVQYTGTIESIDFFLKAASHSSTVHDVFVT